LQLRNFYEQLKRRRVIRAAVIYAALLWALLQVVDLLAEAELVSESVVRWMILLGVVGFPLMLIGSWFVESPWKKRRWTSIAGDLLIIVAIAVAAVLFAWQQWFQTFARPIVAVMAIEATDTRADTADLAVEHHQFSVSDDSNGITQWWRQFLLAFPRHGKIRTAGA